MGLAINTNTTAMNAHRQLAMTSAAQATSTARLSSGYRINSAADDPAGLANSEHLRAQMEGLGQAVNNANDAVNVLKTAEGALGESAAVLRQIRDVAIHASNTGANDTAAAQADQTQIKGAIEALDRIANQTAFGSKKLLDGTGAMSSTVLNPNAVTGATAASSGSSLVAGYADITVTTAATKASKTYSATYADANATVANAGTITINGSSVTVGASDKVQDVLDKINAKTGDTGVTATLTAGGSLKLDQASYGSDKIIAYTESASIFNGGNTDVKAGTDAVATVNQGGTVQSSTTPATAATYTTMGGYGSLSAVPGSGGHSGTMTINGTPIVVGATDTVQNILDNINAQTGTTGVHASLSNGTSGQLKLDQTSTGSNKHINYSESSTIWLGNANVSGTDAVTTTSTVGGTNTTFSAGKGNVLKDAAGDTITLKDGGTTATKALYLSGGALTFQIGANSGETVSTQIGSAKSSALGDATNGYVSQIDVTTAAGAQAAIKIIDSAIQQVSTQRASIGSIQDGIQNTVNALGIAQENITASESTIRDTDMAAEMVKFTRNSIMTQAGVSMLSQANQAPQAILSLLRG